VALPNTCRRSVRALSKCYHNNIGSESPVVKTIELKWVVYHVAEPKYLMNWLYLMGKLIFYVTTGKAIFCVQNLSKYCFLYKVTKRDVLSMLKIPLLLWEKMFWIKRRGIFEVCRKLTQSSQLFENLKINQASHLTKTRRVENYY
jgi:hypothetical protein